jgi:hypothetical protein
VKQGTSLLDGFPFSASTRERERNHFMSAHVKKRPHELRQEVAEHLSRIEQLAGKGASDWTANGRILSEFAQTLSCLSQLAEGSTKRIIWLTWALCFLTLVLTVLTVLQIFK